MWFFFCTYTVNFAWIISCLIESKATLRARIPRTLVDSQVAAVTMKTSHVWKIGCSFSFIDNNDNFRTFPQFL